MMSSLTFGPEWLRALSGGDGPEAQSKPVATKRFKLAEFRYSKEDMLALFEENFKMAKELKDFGDVIMQETQNQPLSFMPLSKDEERLQVAGVNSSVVLRMSGRGAPVRGRGSMRGARGRGRGEGQAAFYRTLSNEEGGFYSSREAYARRPWTEGARGGSSDRIGGRGEPPGGRGGFEQRGRIASDRSGSTDRDAWRGNQEEDDGGGRRVSGQRSWRKGSADASRNWRTDPVKDEDGEQQNKRTWAKAGSEREDGGTYWRQSSSSSNSGLPEWCDDDINPDVGTFDASGQFKSLKSIEDSNSDYERENSDQPVFDGPKDKNNFKSTDKEDKNNQHKSENGKLQKEIENGHDKRHLDLRDRASANNLNGVSVSANSSMKATSRDASIEDDRPSKPLQARKVELSALLSAESSKFPQSQNQNDPKFVNNKNFQNDNDLTLDDVRSVADGMHKILAASRAQPVHRVNDDEDANHNIDHIKNLIEKLDDEIDNIYPTKQFATPNQEVDDCNIADPSIVCAKKAEPGVLIKGMQDWIYRDPQGEIQGPFSSEEMLQWFKAGYFTMGLLVRRVCDEIFLPLGDLIKLWNRVPFQQGPELPSITSQIYAAQLARRQQQEEYQRLLIQQQRKMQQQQQHQQQHQQQQQQQLQHLQQHELRVMQQLKEHQQQLQLKEMQQRPHNLNVSQEVSIWGDSPTASPNLVSTPWSPSSSQAEQLPWNRSKSPGVGLEDIKKLESVEKSEKSKSSDAALQDRQKGDGRSATEPNQDQSATSEKNADLQPSGTVAAKEEEEEELNKTDQSKAGQTPQKSKEKKKKKQDAEKKKSEEREKSVKREEEDRKALEALEKQQQEKLALQKKKEEEERQQQQQAKMEMQQMQYKQQQQQMLQQQQQQMKQYQMLMQQKQRQEQAIMQQQQREQRRQNMSEGPSWNVPVSSNAPSLAEIQKLEEERQMIIREKLKQIQAHEQHLQQQHQRAGAGWSDKSGQPVISLRQIQEEESRKLQAIQRIQQNHQPKVMQGMTNSSVWNSKQSMNYGSYDTQMNASFWDDVMNRGPSVQASSHYHQMNSKPRVVSDSAFPSLSATGKPNKKSKDEELVHRLFQQTNPCDEFIQWVNKNMPEISKYVDVPTFVRFLEDIDSPYEIHEYIRSYFGDSQDTQIFAKEFVEWKRRHGKTQSQHVSSVGLNSDLSAGTEMMYSDADDANAKKKKQKKRMQKVNPSLLGFSCNADPDVVNRGEIQSAMDAWNKK